MAPFRTALALSPPSKARQPIAPTPLATALVAALAGRAVRTDGLMAGVEAQFTAGKTGAASWRRPVHAAFLAGAPPAVAPPPPPPVVAAPAELLPGEEQMTEVDRRKVQGALIRLGYYDQAVDGKFGPDTCAAIRRFQHENGGEPTDTPDRRSGNPPRGHPLMRRYGAVFGVRSIEG